MTQGKERDMGEVAEETQDQAQLDVDEGEEVEVEVIPPDGIEESVALVRSEEPYVPRIKMTPEEALERQQEVHTFLRENLQDGVDFGVIPGCGGKPSLFKPGAEKLAIAFGLAIVYPTELQRRVEDFGEGFFFYAYMAHLVDRASGVVVAMCEGSANSRENRFSKGEGRNPFDQANPVNKMAQKRAFVGGVLVALALSQVFTTDVEDMDWSKRQHGGNQGNGGDSGAFSMDAKLTKGKHEGKTWDWLCVNEPDYVMWAIGRKEGDGLRYLKQDAKNELGTKLDELAEGGGTENRQESTQAPVDTALALLTAPVGFGKKHAERTWLEVFEGADGTSAVDPGRKPDPGYIRWCLSQSKVEGELAVALTALLRDGPPKPATPEQPSNEGRPAEPSSKFDKVGLTWNDQFCRMCLAAKSSPEGEKALAKMHPGLPDELDDWDEPHFELASREFDRHGTLAVLERALKALKADEAGDDPPPDVPTLPKALRDKADSVGDRAQIMGLVDEGDRDAVRAMIHGGSKDKVEEIVGQWEKAIYEKIGSRGRP